MKGAAVKIAVAAVLLAVLAFGVFYTIRYGTQETVQSPQLSEGSPTALGSGDARIQLTEAGFSVTGTGAAALGNRLTISQGGVYHLSGTLSEGQIYVNADSSQEVVLELDGVTLTNTASPVIYVENAGLTTLSLAEGSENLLQSGEERSLETVEDGADSDAAGGAVYARDDLAVTGSGSLTVLG